MKMDASTCCNDKLVVYFLLLVVFYSFCLFVCYVAVCSKNGDEGKEGLKSHYHQI